METGYIFFNKTLQIYCIQELSREPDDRIYAHTIKPYETMNVYINGTVEMITRINERNGEQERWSFLEGVKVQYFRK